MKLKLIWFPIIFLLTGLEMSSCKKDIDDQIPLIEIISPFEGQKYFITDSIHVSAHISDNNVLKSIQVGLVNSEFNSVQQIVYLFPETSDYELEITLPITGTNIETGDYYLYIRAADETNFKNKYQSIHITGLPIVLEKIILITKISDFKIAVSAIGSDFNLEHLFDINSDYASSEIDSKNRKLYLAGMYFVDITALNLDTKEIEWQRAAFPPLPIHVIDCLYFNEFLYASYSNYFIYGFRYNGSMVFNTTVQEGEQPSRIIRLENFLLADLQSKNGGLNYLSTYYAGTGIEKQRIATNYKVLDFYDTGNSQVLVIANENEHGTLRFYDPIQNSESFLEDLSPKINCTVQLSDKEYLIGTENSNFLFELNYQTITDVLAGINAFRLRYDPIDQKIYAANAHKVFVFKYPEIEIQNAITISDSILNLHLFYNR